MLAGYSVPTLLITIGVVSGELSVIISTNIDIYSIVDTVIKTIVECTSYALKLGSGLLDKSIPFKIDMELDLDFTVNPAFNLGHNNPSIDLVNSP